MSRVLGIRGATTADSNTGEAVAEATAEMLDELVRRNGLKVDDVAAAVFSTTADLDTRYPASVARLEMGWEYVALMDVQQADVRGGVPLCIRVLLLVNTDRAPHDLVNVYLRGAAGLREADQS